MKASLACCSLVATSLVSARYAASSKISQIYTNPVSNSLNGDYSTLVSGVLVPASKYTASYPEKRDSPCYMYFYDDLDVNLSFVFLHRAFPLQITNRHVFFWPERASSNFTVRFDSNQKYFDTSLLSVYCGDLTDILGRNTIEQENAELVKIGSFPDDPSKTSHAGYVQLQKDGLNQEACKVLLHFPQGKTPASMSLRDERLTLVQRDTSRRSWQITGFERLESTNGKNVAFDIVYDTLETVAYSYQVVAEMVDCQPLPTKEYDYIKMEETRGL